MSATKQTKKPKASLDTILATVERGFASADKKFTALAEDIADIKSAMATKDDIANVRTEMHDQIGALRTEMHEGFTSLNRRLDQIIQMQLDEHAGRIKKLETAVFPQ